MIIKFSSHVPGAMIVWNILVNFLSEIPDHFIFYKEHINTMKAFKDTTASKFINSLIKKP